MGERTQIKLNLQLKNKEAGEMTDTDAVLTVTAEFAMEATTPAFNFLGEFVADNAAYKDHNSTGIEGWVWKRGPESVGSFQKRWMWVVQHPKPCLRIYENIQSESEMELV